MYTSNIQDMTTLFIAIGATVGFLFVVVAIAVLYAILKSSDELTKIRKMLEEKLNTVETKIGE